MKYLMLAMFASMLNSNALFAQYEVELDTQIYVYTVDPDDRTIPSNYNLKVTQRIDYMNVVFINYDTQELCGSIISDIPDSCARCYVYTDNKGSVASIDTNEFMNISILSKTGSSEIGDTVCAGFRQDCFNDYIKAMAEAGIVDTVFIRPGKTGDLWSSKFVLSDCDYYYNVKHNYEAVYYSFEEMKDENGIPNMTSIIKYEGWWKEGVKNGKWKYYDKNKQLIKTEKYRKGELRWVKV